MKLLLNKTSPYARMVRIVMLEKGLADRVELCWCDPWIDDEQLLAENPVGRIPTLVSDPGVPLTESLLIAHYLNDQDEGENLLPEARKEQVLQLAGLGLGLMDAAFSTVISRKYLNDEANDSVLSQRRLNAIERTLESLQSSMDRYSPPHEISLGDIAVAVALDYILFRLPQLDTAKRYPTLEVWRLNVTERQSFQSTEFS